MKLANQAKPDVIIMDIVMPGLSGIEATKLIKQSNPATAILILTAYSDMRYILGLLEAGASGYLLKSAPVHELIGAIRAVRSGESVLDGIVVCVKRGTFNRWGPRFLSGGKGCDLWFSLLWQLGGMVETTNLDSQSRLG